MDTSDSDPDSPKRISVRERVTRLAVDVDRYEADWAECGPALGPVTFEAGRAALRGVSEAAVVLRDLIGIEETHE